MYLTLKEYKIYYYYKRLTKNKAMKTKNDDLINMYHYVLPL